MINGQFGAWIDEARSHGQHALGCFHAVWAFINGANTTLLIWIVNILLGFIITLFGLLLKAHKERDDERIKELRDEVERIRDRLHEWSPHIGWVDQQRRNGK